MKQANGQRIFVYEVSPRDGFQSEPRFIPTQRKVDFIQRLSHTGVAKIEVTSFVSPKAVPALADAEVVFSALSRRLGVEYAALVPNLRGCERALAAGADELNLVMSASERHNRSNLRMSCADSLAQLAGITNRARGRAHINVSLSVAFGCPFEGRVDPVHVLDLIERFVRMRIERVALCDTTGVADPARVYDLFSKAAALFPHLQFTAHLHNTRGMGLANALAALEAGVVRFDASLGGLGGCPFAPGATGNVCTEDLVHMLQAMGFDTGIELEALLAVAADMPELVGHEVPGQVVKAGPSTRRYGLPA